MGAFATQIGLLPGNDFVNLFVFVSPSGSERVGEHSEHFSIADVRGSMVSAAFFSDLLQGCRRPYPRHHYFVRQLFC